MFCYKEQPVNNIQKLPHLHLRNFIRKLYISKCFCEKCYSKVSLVILKSEHICILGMLLENIFENVLLEIIFKS